MVSEDGKFLYVSETVSVHLGLSQVRDAMQGIHVYLG